MNDDEIAFLLFHLLAETRTYLGVPFGCLPLPPDSAGKIKYAKALIAELPGPERIVVEMAFERTREQIAADRVNWHLATHPTPELTQ
jgi:hypothetical protein